MAEERKTNMRDFRDEITICDETKKEIQKYFDSKYPGYWTTKRALAATIKESFPGADVVHIQGLLNKLVEEQFLCYDGKGDHRTYTKFPKPRPDKRLRSEIFP